MKKVSLLLMVVLLLFSTLSFSQEKININGFGKIQLNMEINSIIDNVKGVIKNTDEYFSIFNDETSTKFVELIADTSDSYCIFGSFSKNVRVFHIGEIFVTEKIALHNVNLYFYKNKLYRIDVRECLNELLELKYGEAEKDIKEKEHTFVNGYGAKFIKTDLKATYTWKTDKNINLLCVDNYYYSDKGKLRHIEYTNLWLINISNKVKTEEEIISNRIKKREEDKEKSKVSGF